MDSNDFNLGYEEVYNDRLGETKSILRSRPCSIRLTKVQRACATML